MKTISIITFLLFSFTLSAKEIGRVTKMRGEIYRTNVDQEVIRAPLSLGGKIHEGDILESENGSFAKLLMADDTIFSIGPATKFAFEEFKMKTKNDRVATYNLIKGKLRSVFTKKSPKKSLHIKTPSAAMGIRGTEIVSDVYKYKGKVKTDIALLHGKLEVMTKEGRKFDLNPSDMFEAEEDGKRLGAKDRAVIKNRKMASNQFRAKKKKLKKKIFDLLKRKPRKGGEVFLFDALKSERKDVSKKAEFHSLTENNKVDMKMTREQKDRVSIFGTREEKEKADAAITVKGERKEKNREPASSEKNNNGQNKKDDRKLEIGNNANDDFDFSPDVSKERRPSSKGLEQGKEEKRVNFFTPNQGPAKRGPASDQIKFDQGPNFDKKPPVDRPFDRPIPKGPPNMNRPDDRPKVDSGAIRKEISNQMDNPEMKRKIQDRIRDNIKRQMIDARTGAAPNNMRQPADSHRIREVIDRQKAGELDKLRIEELERLKKEEYERLMRLRQQNADGTSTTISQ